MKALFSDPEPHIVVSDPDNWARLQTKHYTDELHHASWWQNYPHYMMRCVSLVLVSYAQLQMGGVASVASFCIFKFGRHTNLYIQTRVAIVVNNIVYIYSLLLVDGFTILFVL